MQAKKTSQQQNKTRKSRINLKHFLSRRSCSFNRCYEKRIEFHLEKDGIPHNYIALKPKFLNSFHISKVFS